MGIGRQAAALDVGISLPPARAVAPCLFSEALTGRCVQVAPNASSLKHGLRSRRDPKQTIQARQASVTEQAHLSAGCSCGGAAAASAWNAAKVWRSVQAQPSCVCRA